MGYMKVSGIDAQIAAFDRLHKGADKALEAAVKAGAQLLAGNLAEAAPYRNGDLSRSIKAGKVTYSPGDGFSCEVRPEGKSHGESLAKIGNILEYGHGKVPPSPWFMPTVARSEAEVTRKMIETFQQEQNK